MSHEKLAFRTSSAIEPERPEKIETEKAPPMLPGLGFAPCSGGSGLVGVAVLSVCLLFAPRTFAQEQDVSGTGDSTGPTITTFNVTGAGTAVGQGTAATSIDPSGVVA